MTKIKQLRKKANLTQGALAQAVQVGAKTVYLWEAGKHRPRRYNLIKLAEVLGCGVEELGEKSHG
jgi:DNA-binding XRE family transcriptional regulator